MGVRCIVYSDINTDQFGTFSGEVERLLSPLDTLRKKCHTALHQYPVDFVVASEGSFGPHPSLFFVPADDELLMLMDSTHHLEVVAREVSTETNFGRSDVTSWEKLKAFADDHSFPSHSIILKDAQENFQHVIKGISTWNELEENYKSLLKKSATVHAETDMRACYNPTRMNIIKAATHNLVKKIKSKCPQCSMPGFDVRELISGLPCRWCGMPTRSLLAEKYVCLHCSYTDEKKFPQGKVNEDPSYCDHCNP